MYRKDPHCWVAGGTLGSAMYATTSYPPSKKMNLLIGQSWDCGGISRPTSSYAVPMDARGWTLRTAPAIRTSVYGKSIWDLGPEFRLKAPTSFRAEPTVHTREFERRCATSAPIAFSLLALAPEFRPTFEIGAQDSLVCAVSANRVRSCRAERNRTVVSAESLCGTQCAHVVRASNRIALQHCKLFGKRLGIVRAARCTKAGTSWCLEMGIRMRG